MAKHPNRTTAMALPKKFKQISAQGLVGQLGVNAVEQIVTSMGSAWTRGNPNEVGIDGYIELFDPHTRKALGLHLAVQVKTESKLDSETDDHFKYHCKSEDLDYWQSVTLPVILIVCHKESRKCYWAHIQSKFPTLTRSSNVILFNKRSDAFVEECLTRLVEVGQPKPLHLYIPPGIKRETLRSNLLRVSRFPPIVYAGATDIGSVVEAQRARETTAVKDWHFYEGKILSFHNLNDHAFGHLCRRGEIESFSSFEWGESTDDLDRRRVFVNLINRTLAAQVQPEVRFWPKEECYAFVLPAGRHELKVTYKSAARDSTITAVSLYTSRAQDGTIYRNYRHLAFRGHFRFIDGEWFLEITPTYRFTSDGASLHLWHLESLKGIKRMEGNRAILSAVMLWADYLSKSDGLFASERPRIEFGFLRDFDIDRGIDDSSWSATETSDTERVPSGLTLNLGDY